MSAEPPILDSTRPSQETATPEQPPSRGSIWWQRVRVAINVIFFIEIGMVLAVVPWSGRLWEDNSLLIMHPSLRAFVMHGFTRGALTGLGLINVWIGIWEAVHYTEKT